MWLARYMVCTVTESCGNNVIVHVASFWITNWCRSIGHNNPVAALFATLNSPGSPTETVNASHLTMYYVIVTN